MLLFVFSDQERGPTLRMVGHGLTIGHVILFSVFFSEQPVEKRASRTIRGPYSRSIVVRPTIRDRRLGSWALTFQITRQSAGLMLLPTRRRLVVQVAVKVKPAPTNHTVGQPSP